MLVAIDLFCGLGGWTDGLQAAGFDVIGFDNERHVYGEHRYPAQLVVQDVLTLHGRQFKDADLIVASPPCQEYSYMAMPWTRAKQIARALVGEDEFPEGYTGSRTVDELNRLFDACFRIQREACEAAGRHIPMVVENVRGAIPWVGRSRWNYGSYHLWGDVPALMPMTIAAMKNPQNARQGRNGHEGVTTRLTNPGECVVDPLIKNSGGSWFNVAHNTTSGKGRNPDGRKCPGNEFGDKGFNVAATERYGHEVEGAEYTRTDEDKRSHIGIKRRFASAMIAKIPFPLAYHIGSVYAA